MVASGKSAASRSAMRGREDEPVLARPRQRDRLLEAPQARHGVEQMARVDAAQYRAQVGPHGRRAATRRRPCVGHRALDRALGQAPVGDRQPPRGRDLQRGRDRLDAAGHAGGELERAEERREEALVGVAVGEHEPAQPLGVVGGDELRDGAAGVVAAEDHVPQVALLEQSGDEAREAGRAEVRAGRRRLRVGAERQGRRERLDVLAERGDDLPPQPVVREQAVEEDDGRHAGRRR